MHRSAFLGLQRAIGTSFHELCRVLGILRIKGFKLGHHRNTGPLEPLAGWDAIFNSLGLIIAPRNISPRGIGDDRCSSRMI